MLITLANRTQLISHAVLWKAAIGKLTESYRFGHANDDGSKIFPRSVIEGYYSPLHQYLIRGEDVNSVDASGRSLLHYTAQTHTDETYNCIALLIERGANVNQVTETEGATALHLALQLSGRDVVERTALQLLDAGADYTIRNQRLRNCIDVALAHGHLRLASLMLASESTETLRGTSIRESRPQPPGQMDDRLLQRDSANAGGEVARANLTLHEAQHGAAQEARRKLHHLKAEESNVMLREAVLKGDVQLARYCLSEGADPNVEFKGAYCLHYAVHRSEINRVEMVDLLCDFGADVNMIDYEDDTPMNLCIKTSENRRRGEMADIVKKLLSFKADRDTKDLDGKDALTLAKTYGYQDIVSLLQSFSGPYRTPSRTPSRSPVRSMGSPFKRTPSVQNTPADEEIDHSKPDENGLYPIHLLILNDEIDESFKADLIDEFKLEKVDFNVASVNDKDTALHFAVGRKEKLSMMKLISGSANPDQANAEGITPRDLIERLEDDEFKKAFEEALAKQNAAKNWKRAGNKAKNCVLL